MGPSTGQDLIAAGQTAPEMEAVGPRWRSCRDAACPGATCRPRHCGLIGPLQGASASVARVAQFLWIAWFSAFDAIAGIATGVLQNEGFGDVAKLLFQHQTVGGEFSLLGSVAHPMWIVVAVAAGLSLRRNGARPITWWANVRFGPRSLHMRVRSPS